MENKERKWGKGLERRIYPSTFISALGFDFVAPACVSLSVSLSESACVSVCVWSGSISLL